jgi:hypothetical protein
LYVLGYTIISKGVLLSCGLAHRAVFCPHA